jgi:DNA-binding transcriptional ArsR family regulator
MDAPVPPVQDDVTIFEALAQPTRLAALRHLLAAGAAGLPAGNLARLLDVPHNTLSFHLAFLVKAGLARAAKSGRQVIYTADTARFQALIRTLAESGACGVTEDPRTGAALIELSPAAAH